MKTVILAVPTAAINAAVTEAVNCVALIYVVVSEVPFHLTVEPLMKFVPFTVRVNAGLPAVAVFGESDVAVGTGLLPAAVIVNGKPLDVPPPGAEVTTVILAVPDVAIRAALMLAVNCNGPTNVVVIKVPFQ